MCSGVGRGSILELQQSCKKFYEKHMGCGPVLLLCRINNRITNTVYADGHLKPFLQKSHHSSASVRYAQLLVCESQLVVLVIYRRLHEVIPC